MGGKNTTTRGESSGDNDSKKSLRETPPRPFASFLSHDETAVSRLVSPFVPISMDMCRGDTSAG